MKTVQIQRGIQGSGKSTKANLLLNEAKSCGKSVGICSADNFFLKNDGSYDFNVRLLSEAHKYCLEKFVDLIFNNVELIIVDNTNIKINDFELYIKIAHSAGYSINVQELKPRDNTELEMWAKRCIHNVPIETVKKRWSMWEEIPQKYKHLVNVI